MEAMIEQRQTEDLADAFKEAYGRGTAWKEAIRKSMDQIEDDARKRVTFALADGIRKLERHPAEFDLEEAPANITSGLRP
jgi:CHASE3 domain sensor protein